MRDTQTESALYERYLTAFTCGASGAVAHPCTPTTADGTIEQREAMEAAQALGQRDGLRCKSNPIISNDLLYRSPLLNQVDKMLAPREEHALYFSPDCELRIYAEGLTDDVPHEVLKQGLEEVVRRLLKLIGSHPNSL